MKKPPVACVILAAGKGSRMKSDVPKVLHQMCGRTVLAYVLETVKKVKFAKRVIVVGHKHEEVRKHIPNDFIVVKQKELSGTATAVKEALSALKGFKGTILILYADTPLLKIKTIEKLLEYHANNNCKATLLTAVLNEPAGYGRIIRDKYASISRIVEDKDADDFDKSVKEINTGIMCFDAQSLVFALKRIQPENRKKEYYLTDAISILSSRGDVVDALKIKDVTEVMGINSRVDLAKAALSVRSKLLETLMLKGVTIVDPSNTVINYDAKIGQDTIIYPFTVIDSNVIIGKRCSVGPFAHLREGTTLKDDVVVGNFLEIVRSTISSRTFAKHFCYIGDTHVGRSVNIGAGTVTANFDGLNKHHTVIGDQAYIGSDTILVAPVKIGKAAKTGAGCVVVKNHNVADGTVVAGVPARKIGKVR